MPSMAGSRRTGAQYLGASVNTSKAAIDRHFKTGHHTCGERDGLRSTAGSPGASSAHVDHGFPGRGSPTRIVVCVHVGDDGLWSLWAARAPSTAGGGKRAPPAAARPGRATAFSISLAGSRGPREPLDRRGCRKSAARARPVTTPLSSHCPGWYGSVAGPSLVCTGRRSCGGATVPSARGGARRAARGRWSRRFGWGPPSRLGSHVRVQFGPPAARSTLEHVRVVEEAVEERGHRRGVAEELPPVVHGSV